MIYFDNAATTYPKPRQTAEAANEAFTRYGANPGRGGHEMSLETGRMVYAAREKLIRLFGGEDPERVVFTQNCTAAINQAVKGTLRPGDHVIISSMEHNSVFRPMESLRSRGLITYDIARVDVRCPERTVENFRSLIRPETHLICCVHGSNVFGTLQPVRELCALAHERGILFLMDAAQTAGVMPIRLDEIPADFLCIAAHKGLYAPAALGALIVGTDQPIATLLEGGSGSLSKEPFMPPFLPDRLEAGTLNTFGIAGLTGGLRFLEARGMQNLRREEMEIIGQIYCGLATIPGVILYNRPQLPVLSFNISGLTGEETAEALNRRGFALRGGFHCSPLAHWSMGTWEPGTARISVGAFNTHDQAGRLVCAVRDLCKKQAESKNGICLDA